MNVVICSAFRNSAAYVGRYFDQMDALDRLITKHGDVLSIVVGYGDSTDDTAAQLFEHTSGGIGTRFVNVTHGGPTYGSVVDAERFKQLAYIGNKIFANVPDDADVAIWLEGDLIWKPGTITKLLAHLSEHSCVAPMIMDSPPADTFYDTFAYRKDGVHFTKEPPYHAGLTEKLVEMDSVGSCVAMRGEYIRKVIVPDDTVIVGVCAQIRELGGDIVLDTSLTLYHP